MEHPRVGEHGATRQIAEGAIPDLDQAEQSRNVLDDRGRCHVLVDRPESGEHLAERVGTDCDHEGQPDGGVHRVAPADPIPEAEHVVGVDPERCDLGGVGRHGNEVGCHGIGAK